MIDPRGLGARELILAVFRLAVADFLALSYGYDGAARLRKANASHRTEAADFLSKPWAGYLGGLIDLPVHAVLAESRRRIRAQDVHCAESAGAIRPPEGDGDTEMARYQPQVP